jgi:hypothetical protein
LRNWSLQVTAQFVKTKYIISYWTKGEISDIGYQETTTFLERSNMDKINPKEKEREVSSYMIFDKEG